ncbi:hypothetical protein OS187_13340, partial [Xanthomonadaceae bacterium JHOS43]|nr:hypothetical protein [Xanthomonadaceae bacterium JHOS43]
LQSGSSKPCGDAGGVHSIIQADAASRRGLIQALGGGMDRRWFPFPIAVAAVLAGVAGQAFVMFWKASSPLGAGHVGFFAWGCIPYVVCLAIARWGHPNYGFWSALACIAGDAITYHSVFVSPQSSTAGLAYLGAPLANVFFFIPVGVLLGYLNQRFAEREPAP